MQKSSFFSSSNGDRKYNASDWAEYFSAFIGNGVYPNPSTNLQILSTNNGYKIKVGQGKAFINGYFYVNTTDLETSVEAAHPYLNRVDLVVLRLADRKIEISILKGDVSSTPFTPTIKRDSDRFELALAKVNISKGATTISQSDIVDLRLNKEYCGLVTNVVETVDATTLYNQYSTEFKSKIDTNQTQFEAWFNNAKGQMDADLGTRILEQINNLQVGVYRNVLDKKVVDLTMGNWNLSIKGNTKYSKNGVLSDVWQEGNTLLSVGDETTDRTKININGSISYIPTVLRKLNNTVYDEVLNDKLIKRVGKMVLNGSEKWIRELAVKNDNNILFYTPRDNIGSKVGVSDTLKVTESTIVETYSGEGILPSQTANVLYVRIIKSKLVQHGYVESDLASGVPAFKKWLQANLTTVLYELKTPIISYHNNNYTLLKDGFISIDETLAPAQMIAYKDLDSKQEKEDYNLATVNKNLVGAINENKGNILKLAEDSTSPLKIDTTTVLASWEANTKYGLRMYSKVVEIPPSGGLRVEYPQGLFDNALMPQISQFCPDNDYTKYSVNNKIAITNWGDTFCRIVNYDTLKTLVVMQVFGR